MLTSCDLFLQIPSLEGKFGDRLKTIDNKYFKSLNGRNIRK